MSWELAMVSWDDFMNTPLNDEERKIIDAECGKQVSVLKEERKMKEKLDNWFTYRYPREGDAKRYEEIRKEGRKFAQIIVDNTPSSADQTAAIRKIREAVMTANAAIACGGK